MILVSSKYFFLLAALPHPRASFLRPPQLNRQEGRINQNAPLADLFSTVVKTRPFRRVRAKSGSKVCSELKQIKSWHDSSLCEKVMESDAVESQTDICKHGVTTWCLYMVSLHGVI